MTLRHLQIFSTVCRLGSVTKAADELNMAQPAVSHSIRELESYYQAKLFERMNRRLYITDAGERLRHYGDAILAQADEARNVLRDMDAVARVRIGANMSFGIGRLPGLLGGFGREHPDVPVYTVIQNSSQVEDKLLKNSLDFGLMDAPTNSELLIGKMIGWDKTVALCGMHFEMPEGILYSGEGQNKGGGKDGSGAGNGKDVRMEAAGIADVLTLPLLLREPGSGVRRRVDELLEREHVKPRIVMESTSILSLVEMCERGFGILFLPETVAAPYITQERLQKIDVPDAEMGREYFLVYHRAKFHTKSMRKFQDYVMKSAFCGESPLRFPPCRAGF